MDSSLETPQQQKDLVPAQGRTLQVDFSWKKFTALIADKDNPGSEPIYIVDFKPTKPHLVFKSAADNSVLGSGTLHTISINADCEIRGHAIKLEALKRFKTEYTHLSHAFSNTDAPVPMTWSSSSDWKNWDFICLNRDQLPVAKFSANIWGVKRIGNVEFLEPTSDAARDEIVVVGLTLFYCMVLRMNNVLSLFGAVFSRPGHACKGTPATELDELDSKKVR